MKRTLVAGLVLGIAGATSTGAMFVGGVPVGAGTEAATAVSQAPAGSAATDDQPRFVNVKLDARAAAPDLASAFKSFVAGQQAPGWIGYGVPALPGDHDSCGDCGPGRCGTYLEGRRTDAGTGSTGRKVSLEGPRSLAVLFRVERASVQKIRVVSPDCEVDAGGLPLRWLTGVVPADSVSLLASFVTAQDRGDGGDQPSDNTALMAIAMHADPAATRALDRFVAAGQPLAIRKHAAFWLGAARGREGFERLRALARSETDTAFRKELVFPISLSKEPESADVLIDLARRDASGEVRKQALFWLSQKAGAKVAATLASAVANDPDAGVKDRAVFALSQLPKGEGVPLLIEVARTNSSPAVRKKAMFWLGQSNDPRALDFFAQVLGK